MNRDSARKIRLCEVLNLAWEISQFTLARWLDQSGLPQSKRSALDRLLAGESCDTSQIELPLLSVASRILACPLDDLTSYVRTARLSKTSRLARCLAARIWYPNPRNVDEHLYRIWLAGRAAKQAYVYSVALPEFLTPASITTRVHRSLATHAGGDIGPAVEALDSYRRQRWLAMQQPDRPSHVHVTVSMTNLIKMARLQFPFDGCVRSDMNECIETVRFVHLTRSDLTLQILDDRQAFRLQSYLQDWDTIGCIGDSMSLRRLPNSPATLWYDPNATRSEETMFSQDYSILSRLSRGEDCVLLGRQEMEDFLESCLSRKAWGVRRRSAIRRAVQSR